MSKMSKKTALIVLAVFAGVLAAVFYARGPAAAPRRGPAGLSLDAFARCLAAKGAVMYGAYWCPHCQREKGNFGASFQFVKYVECATDTKKCADAGIQGFPTWVYPDGRRFVGEQGIAGISRESGCPLPVGYDR